MSLVDPRLLSSKRLVKTSMIQKYAGIQHRFQSHTKASEIIRNVNLRGKVAMVTGANSGLGIHAYTHMRVRAYVRTHTHTHTHTQYHTYKHSIKLPCLVNGNIIIKNSKTRNIIVSKYFYHYYVL